MVRRLRLYIYKTFNLPQCRGAPGAAGEIQVWQGIVGRRTSSEGRAECLPCYKDYTEALDSRTFFFFKNLKLPSHLNL